MDSPERNRIVAASSSTSSPTVQESPFFNFLSNLSPIKPIKSARYAQRLLEANIPPPQPVFTSPRIDLQREPNFLKRDETNDAGSDVYGQFETVSNIVLMPCSEKEVQSSSPSGCVDDYLADPMEGEDFINSAELHPRKAKDAPQALQSGFTGKKELVTKSINGTKEKNAEIGSSMCSTTLDQAVEDRPRNALELVQLAGNQRDAERVDEFPHFMSEKVVYLASDEQHCEQIAAQIAGGPHDEWGCTQSFSESLQMVEAYEDSGESSRPVLQGSVEEATQNNRGTRRHLQFERIVNCRSSTAGGIHCSQHVTTKRANSRLAAGLNRFVSLASHMEPGRTCSIQQSVSDSQTTTQHSLSMAKRPDAYTVIVGSLQNDGKSNISAPMPCGIGLHLNSIGQAAAMSSDVVTRMKLDGEISTEKKSGTQNLAKDPNSIAREISSYAVNGHQESQGIEAATSAAFRSTNSMNPPNTSQNLRLLEQDSSPFTGGRSDSENADRYKELNQVSPKKKRKKAPITSDNEGCKHCNCKRSKCLKLYCECFAAGVYCADSCACENCFNKPEYEDTVLDTRQQIESRNPLAFAPKVVKLGTDSPANIVDDGNRVTPSSARHKRGCNCKKSMCLKKYCECYQAKVGCSDGCRCEGCENSFGKKAETMYRKAGRLEGPSQEKLETTDIGTASVDKLKLGFPLRNRYLSPESVSIDQEWDSSKVGGSDLFSPTWEGLADFSHFTPLSRPYPGTVASLDASSSRDFSEVSRAKLLQGNRFQSSTDSLRWYSSSISLMPQPSGSKAPHELSSDCAKYDLVEDDDTPEILKDTSTPTKAVKVCSPNKKRVSPPHFRLQELRSSSSPGLKSGRKFILQAVPSFPPLTPYSNSKEGVDKYRSYPNVSSSDQ